MIAGIPTVAAAALPTVTAEQMRRVDRLAVHELGLGLLQMMENAGARLADLALRRFRPRSCLVMAGPGGNGGGGLAAARHLANRGVPVRVVLAAEPDRLSVVTAHQLGILRRMGVPVDGEPAPADLVVDALLGYGLTGDPRGRAADLIRWTLARPPVLALDTPSGLDVDTGRAGEPCVRANATLTLALPKPGLLTAPEHVGELYLADVSIPAGLYERAGVLAPPPFRAGPVLRVLP